MLHARELADRIDLTNGAKTSIFNQDGVFGIHKLLQFSLRLIVPQHLAAITFCLE
jgi:hypothetical protein